MKAIWNGKTIAESDDIVNVEGNSYFPADSILPEYISESDTKTDCHWKGTASYYNLNVDNKTNIDSVWYYPSPSGLAKSIKNRIAFWKGVEIVK